MEYSKELDLESLRKAALDGIKILAEKIGYDGEYLTSFCQAPYIFSDLAEETRISQDYYQDDGEALGMYVAPDTLQVQSQIQLISDPKIVAKCSSYGMILINDKFRQLKGKHSSDDKNLFIADELFTTIIHEHIHGLRNVLLHDFYRNDDNARSYFKNGTQFEPTTTKMRDLEVDFSQEIYKDEHFTASFGDAEKNEQLDDDEVDDIQVGDDPKGLNPMDTKIEKQTIIDEALVELMAQMANILHYHPEWDIWKVLEMAVSRSDNKDISVMAQIIKRHGDFDLFKWMLNPFDYTVDDVHFDFFAYYTKKDKDLVSQISDPDYLDDSFEI